MGTSTVSRNKRSKAAKSALAIALALLLALSSTFALTMYNLTARNQLKAASNPGGRLHDDFIWTADEQNKDVYVENFADAGEGENIYVRVQLREYLEKGPGAGSNTPADSLQVFPTGADKTSNENWSVYNFTSPVKDGEDDIHDWFTFSFGGQTVYMPTFDKSSESDKADVNGSLYDESGNEINYSNYHKYALGEVEYATEELTGGISKGAAMHHAKETLTSQVITMTKWNELGSPVGRYWVYDDAADGDGWFYWAQPVEPGTATGLLLDNVELTKKVGTDWYYQIDAVADVVTGDELTEETPEGGTGKAYYLGKDAADRKTLTEGGYKVLHGAASVDDEIDKIRSAPVAMNNAVASEVTLDGRAYYKLAQDGNKVMLMTKNLMTNWGETGAGPFDGFDNHWGTSAALKWCQTTYYDSLPGYTKSHIVDTTYNTREDHDSKVVYSTTSKVFFLSEADVFGTENKNNADSTNCYTYHQRLIPEDDNLLKATLNGSEAWWWLRSPSTSGTGLSVVGTDGYCYASDYFAPSGSARPVFWVNLEF